MFLYLPVTPDCEVDNPPTIDIEAARFAEAIRTYTPPEEPEEDDGGWGRRNASPELKAMENFHKDRPGWMTVLAWSHGCSNSGSYNGRSASEGGNMQDLSVTKYSDNASPVLTVMVMSGEVMPVGLLRVCHVPKDGKVKVIEFHLKRVSCTSQSTGGSGGEDRLTENISLTFGVMFLRHMEIVVETGVISRDIRAGWDLEKKKGEREGLHNPLPLKNLAQNVAQKNIEMYDQYELSKLPKAILELAGASHYADRAKIPLKGRRMYVTDEDLGGGSSDKMFHYREFFLKEQTLAALTKAVAGLYGVDPSKVEKFYRVGGMLILIENDRQVDELGDSVTLNVVFKK